MRKHRADSSEIPEALHRGINLTLILCDEALCEIEHWAVGREQHSVLYHEQKQLSDVQRTEIMTELHKARESLRMLRDSLSLDTEVHNAAARIRSLCAFVWQNLVELQEKHLHRYGAPSAELEAKLAPEVESLIASVCRIEQVVET